MNCKLRFLLTFLMILSIWVTNSSSRSNHNQCYADTMPAIRNMLHGVDITKFNVFTMDHLCDGVLSVSCESNQTWSNAQHLPNRTFTLPDQVARMTVNESNQLHSPQVLWAHDMIDMQNILLSMTQQTDNLIGACSQNSDYYDYLRNYFTNNASLALVTSHLHIYSIEFKAPSELILSTDFVDDLKKLPVKYAHNPTDYNNFVATYGTHYIEGANLGDTDYWIKSIPNKYASNEKAIEDTLKAQFLNMLQHLPHGPMEPVKEPKDFDQICSDVQCYDFQGGLSWELGNFLDELYLVPGFTEYLLRPIEDLFADKNMKAKMKYASEMYRIGSYLGELKNAYKFSNYYQLSDEDQVSLNKVEAFLSSNSSTINAEQAIEIIDDLYSKVEGKPHIDQLINDYYVTAAVKLQFANSMCDRSAGQCPSKAIVDEKDQLENLYNEYESLKANASQLTREVYHQFGRKARELGASHRIYVDLHRGLGASCEKC